MDIQIPDNCDVLMEDRDFKIARSLMHAYIKNMPFKELHNPKAQNRSFLKHLRVENVFPGLGPTENDERRGKMEIQAEGWVRYNHMPDGSLCLGNYNTAAEYQLIATTAKAAALLFEVLLSPRQRIICVQFAFSDRYMSCLEELEEKEMKKCPTEPTMGRMQNLQESYQRIMAKLTHV